MITSDDLFQAFTRVPEIRKAETEGFCVAASSEAGGSVSVYISVCISSLFSVTLAFLLKLFSISTVRVLTMVLKCGEFTEIYDSVYKTKEEITEQKNTSRRVSLFFSSNSRARALLRARGAWRVRGFFR